MKWMIVADSSCDLMQLETKSKDIAYQTVPFQMTLDGVNYTDDEGLDVPSFVSAMESSKESHSACPSPETWARHFEQADRSIAITISSRLSGSYNSAIAAKGMVEEQYPEKRIEVIDSVSTGPKLVMLVQLAARLMAENKSFEQVCEACRNMAANVRTIFTLASFHNLVQNGRVSKFAGFIAGKLNIRVIGVGTDEGTIHLKELMRGEKKTLRNIVACMQEDGYNGSDMAVSQCLNPRLAEDLKTMILEKWQRARVQILPTRGLDSYYAERDGLIICYAGQARDSAGNPLQEIKEKIRSVVSKGTDR